MSFTRQPPCLQAFRTIRTRRHQQTQEDIRGHQTDGRL